MPDVWIDIDLGPLQRVLKEYLKVSKKGLAEDINTKAYHICMAASALTKKADKAKIAQEIGPTAKEVIGHKVRITKRRITKAEHEAKHGKTP